MINSLKNSLSPFLSKLGFLKRLIKIEQLEHINNDIEEPKVQESFESPQIRSSETTQLSVPPAVLKTLRLPRIVVIGDEKSGKSSTLERIAHAEVFPKNSRICTRQPIVLKLHHDPQIITPVFKLHIPNYYTQSEGTILDAMAVQREISERMKWIFDNKKGIIMDEEIIVEITSADVPTIELVDMPGLIAVRTIDDSEPHELAEMTEKCTRKYLDDPDTGIVVCVIDAAIGNLRCVKAIRMVQESRKEIQDYTIGVLAKPDLSYYINWEDEARTGPLWKLEDRLMKKSDDGVELGCGYVSVKNRNTSTVKLVSLIEHNNSEERWFIDNIKNPLFVEDDGKLTEIGKFNIGLQALINKIDMVICKHLDKVWAPEQRNKYKQQREELEKYIINLGKSPNSLQVVQVLSHTNDLLIKKLTPEWVDQQCKGVIELLNVPAETQMTTMFERIIEQKSLRDLVDKCLNQEKYKFFKFFSDNFINEIKICFSGDNKGDIQLCRFTSLEKIITEIILSNFEKSAPEFNVKCKKRLDLIQMLPIEKKRDQFIQVLMNSLMEFLFCPLLYRSPETDNLFPFVWKLHKEVAQLNENEDRVRDRLNSERKLENIKLIEETLHTFEVSVKV